jgi:hypothetical protein
MLVLAIMLGAAIATCSGSESVSSEVALSQVLDLRGEWVGYIVTASGIRYGVRVNSQGVYTLHMEALAFAWQITDEGAGSFSFGGAEDPCLGIYKQQRDHLAICFTSRHMGRPTSFQGGKGNALLILHRLKTGK